MSAKQREHVVNFFARGAFIQATDPDGRIGRRSGVGGIFVQMIKFRYREHLLRKEEL